MTPRQLAFELPHRPALGAEDFLVAPANRDAVGWLDRWPDWPTAGLVIWGPEGCGKSHLLQVWRERSGARVLPAAGLTVEAVPELARTQLALDDADRGVHEAALFHLLNLLNETRVHVVLTARTPAARWDVKLPDLRSRLLALPSVAVASPDDDLMRAVLAKLFADRQLRVGAEVIDYLVTRIERSFAAMRGVVAALDAAALSRHRNLTVALAREVLERMQADNQGELKWS